MKEAGALAITQRYSIRGLWSLFLICAFPIHLWALVLIFRDMDWVILRTNVWDAIGVGSYGMINAFAESVIIFMVFAILGLFLTPPTWNVDKRVAFLSLLVLLLSAWGMIAQLLFLWKVSLPESALRFLAESEHPVRIMVAASFAIVAPTFLIPVYLFLRRDKMIGSIRDLSERLSLLTVFYLFFDLASLIIILIRNY